MMVLLKADMIRTLAATLGTPLDFMTNSIQYPSVAILASRNPDPNPFFGPYLFHFQDMLRDIALRHSICALSVKERERKQEPEGCVLQHLRRLEAAD